MNGVASIMCIIRAECDAEPFYEEVESFSTLEIRRYRSGEEALRALREPSGTQPNLLIVTYDLPLMHGGFFAAHCRRLPRLRHVPIVLLVPSGCDDRLVQELYAAGVDQIVELGAERAEWVQRVRAILGYWAAVRSRHQRSGELSIAPKEREESWHCSDELS